MRSIQQLKDSCWLRLPHTYNLPFTEIAFYGVQYFKSFADIILFQRVVYPQLHCGHVANIRHCITITPTDN